jgi:hypothetical protein
MVCTWQTQMPEVPDGSGRLAHPTTEAVSVGELSPDAGRWEGCSGRSLLFQSVYPGAVAVEMCVYHTLHSAVAAQRLMRRVGRRHAAGGAI